MSEARQMTRGPKGPICMDPLDLSNLPGRGPRRVQAFCQQFLIVPTGKGARTPFKLRKWQLEIVAGLFPSKGNRPRQAAVVLPRANGKTSLAAVLSLYALFADNEEGAQVAFVASDLRQASIGFNMARRMLDLSPELSARAVVYGSDTPRIYVPGTDSTLMALPSDPKSLQGFSPSFCVVDELHVVNDEVWEAMTLASGKRERSMVLAVSTPSDEITSVMWSLVKRGREAPDPQFYFKEYGAPEGHPSDCEHCWKIANPALDDFLFRDAMTAVHKTTREGAFRRFRLAQWLVGADKWLPFGAWDACADASRIVPDHERVTLFFDGSASGDSTALVGCTITDPHLFVINVWASPDGDARWRVPRGEVGRTVQAAFLKYDVVEMATDPWGWRSEIEAWSERWPARVVEWPTNVIHRMGPATDRTFQAVVSKQLTHDGDSRLAEHIGNANAKSTPSGDVIVKDRKWSPHKIDAAVCAIGAYDRAIHHAKRKAGRKVRAW